MSGNFGSRSSPSTTWRSVRQTAQHSTRRRSCSAFGCGTGPSRNSSGLPASRKTIACMGEGYTGWVWGVGGGEWEKNRLRLFHMRIQNRIQHLRGLPYFWSGAREEILVDGDGFYVLRSGALEQPADLFGSDGVIRIEKDVGRAGDE